MQKSSNNPKKTALQAMDRWVRPTNRAEYIEPSSRVRDLVKKINI